MCTLRDTGWEQGLRDLFCRSHIQVIRDFQQSQNSCMIFIQCWANVEDVGPTLYKYHTAVLCLLGYPAVAFKKILNSLF